MSIYFTHSDLEIFDILGFKERMAVLKSQIRPKLTELGEKITPLLSTQFKQDFYSHVAKHIRRKVNPPDETWVAFGPESRGYKAYIYFSLCIGKRGVQARVVMKDESPNRAQLAENLLRNSEVLEKRFLSIKNLSDYTQIDRDYNAKSISNLSSFVQENAPRLKNLKTAVFDVGIDIPATSKNIEQEFLKTVDLLYPFYLCGLQREVCLT